MDRRLACRGIVFADDKLLCVQQKHDLNFSDPWPQDVWCLPGGKTELGEDLISCVKREIIEELGVKPQIGRLLYIQQFKINDQLESLEFFFHITNHQDFKNINLVSTSHGLQEIAKVDFIDPKSHQILPNFLMSEDIGSLISSNKPVKIFNYLN